MDKEIEEVLKKVITVQKAAEVMGVSTKYVYYLIQTNRIKHYKLEGGRKYTYLINKADALKFERAEK